ncbi:MAG: dicarboxylate/amino acid:cation symporter [Deltaproteobacteria bacterium]|nr:dicarboxylate/amino acid:cation symporter [Deltaproteobacteria bacterium]
MPGADQATALRFLPIFRRWTMPIYRRLLVLLLFYLVMVVFLARRSPIKFLAGIKYVMLLAFSTSSSAAVMPLSIQTAEEKLGVRSSIAEFTIPIGATVNMDGTAVYQAVATIFLAQATGVELSMGALALVVVTTVGASIGSPSTLGVGIGLLYQSNVLITLMFAHEEPRTDARMFQNKAHGAGRTVGLFRTSTTAL